MSDGHGRRDCDGIACILEAGEYGPGDPPPPRGYIQWYRWAEVQIEAGLKQATCGRCGKWRFPQELSDRVDVSKVFNRRGREITHRSPVCKECVNP